MGQLAHPLTIRAHHLLCILGFRGLGYSSEFIAMMGKVVGELNSNPTLPLVIGAECDIICASCPHKKGNKCLKKVGFECKVKTQDLAVLQKLGWETGSRISASNAWLRIKEKLTPENIAEICQDCEWLGLGYCADGLRSLDLG